MARTYFGQMLEHSDLKVFESRAQLLCFVPISKKNGLQGTLVTEELKPLSEWFL